MEKDRILIIEDDAAFGQIIKTLLNDSNYQSTHVPSGEKALLILERIRFELILLDIGLPEGTDYGFELCKIIKNKIGNIPIIFMTGQNKDESIIKSYKSGGQDYIEKGGGHIFKEELLARVKTHIKLSKATNNIKKQKEEIEIKNKDIQDSINTARDIQDAIMQPFEKNAKDFFKDNYFILNKPKDIVSGDFYWFEKINNYYLHHVVADCTGHGVPGAIMSMLGVSFLNEIVIDKGTHESNQILNKMRSNVIKALQQTGTVIKQKEGMDLALCSINLETLTLNFSGANNPLYILRHKDNPPVTINNNDNKIIEIQEANYNYILYEIKPDRMPIGIYPKMDDFTINKIDLEEDDTIYMFSDGYADQFGGNKGKKLKIKPFKKLILSIQNTNMKNQKNILESELNNWQGKLEQVDDILVVGIKITNS